MTDGRAVTRSASGSDADASASHALRPIGTEAPASVVDHVWANVRAHLPGGVVATACQLGGDRLAPHLSKLANSVVVVGTDLARDASWTVLHAAPDRTPFADGCFELVVVDDIARTGRPAAAVLDEAVRLCSRGGAIVVGYRRFRSNGAVRDRLAGRPAVRAVALPAVPRPAFLVDPHDRAASSYFVRQMAFAYRAPGSRGARARWQAMRNHAATVLPPAMSIALAPARIAVSSTSTPDASLLHDVEDLVRSSWTSMALPGEPPDRLQPLLVGHRRPDTGVVTALLFAGHAGGPAVVAKMPRYGSVNAALQREDHALELVSAAVTAPIRRQLPRSLGVHQVQGTDVLLQSGVPGRHLVTRTASRRLRPARFAAQLELMLSWCLDLQRASGRPAVVNDALISERLEPLARAGLDALGGDVGVAALLDRTLEQAAMLRGTSVPMVVAHGDYWAGNVTVDAGSVAGVVDWERAMVDDLPIWDPVKAVGSSGYHLDRYRSIPRRGAGAIPSWYDLGPWKGIADPRFARGFRAMFAGRGWLAERATDALVRMFSVGGIPLGWLPVGVTFYLVRQVTQSLDAPRSVEGWGSVLRALATSPETWAEDFVGVRQVVRPGERAPARAAPVRPREMDRT
jgi:hypothetical protein